MDKTVIIQTIGATLSGIFLFYMAYIFNRNAKHTDDRLAETDKKLDGLSLKLNELSSTIQSIKDDLIERVSVNRLDNEKLNTKIEKLEARVDNLEKIIDRRQQ